MRLGLDSSLRWKILAVVILGLILPAAAAGWLSYRTAYQIIYRQSISHQSRILDQLNQELLTLQDRSRQQIQALAQNPLLESALDQKARLPEELLQNYLRRNPEWSELVVFDNLAQERWRWPPGVSAEPYDPFFLENLPSEQGACFLLRLPARR